MARSKSDAPAEPVMSMSAADAAWVRREIALAAAGHSEESRRQMNPGPGDEEAAAAAEAEPAAEAAEAAAA